MYSGNHWQTRVLFDGKFSVFRWTTRKSNDDLEKKIFNQYSCTHNFIEIYWSIRFCHSCSILLIIVIDRLKHTETNNKMCGIPGFGSEGQLPEWWGEFDVVSQEGLTGQVWREASGSGRRVSGGEREGQPTHNGVCR